MSHSFLARASVLLVLAACGTKATSDTRAATPPPAATPEVAVQRAMPAPSAPPPPTVEVPASPSSGPPGCARNFAAFDANSDGGVSSDEFLARPHALPDPDAMFAARDRNTDGTLTVEEFCMGWGAAGDSRVSRGTSTGSSGAPGAGMGAARGPGIGMGPGGMHKGRGGGPRCAEHFERFDANGDGSVTEPELGAFPHPHGDAHQVLVARDQDRDGRLSKAEFCAPWNPPAQPSAP